MHSHPLFWLVFLLYLGGCAAPGPHRKPAPPLGDAPVPTAWSAPVPSPAKLPLTSGLLDWIDDPRLTALVCTALAQNPDLRATALRLRAAHLDLTGTDADRWPELAATLGRGQNNQETNPDGSPKTADRSRLGLVVNWEIDLWGRLADLQGSAVLAQEALEADYRRARDLLAVRVVQGWIRAVAARLVVGCETERIEALTAIEAIVTERYRRGLGPLDELAAAQTRTAVARADRIAGQKGFEEAVRALELLLGRPPATGLLVADTLPRFSAPAAGAPATVLLDRPDIQAALARFEAADKAASAAAKALLPSIRLSATLSRDATYLGALSSAATIWDLMGSLSQPVFQGGRLRARHQAHRIETEAAWEDYRAAVLQALGEVENALCAEALMAEERCFVALALEAAQKSRRHYTWRYRTGVGSLMDLLSAREAEMSIQRRSLALAADRLANAIDLGLALGKGVAGAS